jgi:hypothetical protein
MTHTDARRVDEALRAFFDGPEGREAAAWQVQRLVAFPWARSGVVPSQDDLAKLLDWLRGMQPNPTVGTLADRRLLPAESVRRLQKV